MEREPRSRGTGVLTAEDWWRLAGIGTVMMVGTLAVLDAYYPGGLFTLFASGSAPNAADETHARTMAFTTLMMFQLFNVFNCRSSWRSAFERLLRKQVADCRGGVVAVHPRARGLRAVPAGRVPHGGAVGVRLDGRDRRRLHPADRHGAGEIGPAQETTRSLCLKRMTHNDCETGALFAETIGGKNACRSHDAGDGFGRQGGGATRGRKSWGSRLFSTTWWSMTSPSTCT